MDEIKERACYHREALDEPLVEVDKSKEYLDIHPVLWDRPFMDFSYLYGIYRDFVLQDNKSQIFNPLLLELAFLRVQKQLVFGQDLQYSLDSLYMLFHKSSKDEIDYYYTFCNEIPEDIVHYCLENDQTVGYFEEYYKRFEQAMVSTESSLPLIARLNIYVIKPSLDIKLDEVFGSTKL